MAHKIANTTPPSFEGLDEPKASPQQETEPQKEQSTEQPQETSTPVEGVNSASSNTEKPSDDKPRINFAQQRIDRSLKKKVQYLEEQIKALSQKTQTAQSPAPVQTGDFWEKFNTNPEVTLAEKVKAEAAALFAKMNEEKEQKQKEKELESQWRDAEKMMQSSEFAKKDPKFLESLAEIVEKYGLDHYGEKNPTRAMEAALEIYTLKVQPPTVKKPFADSAPTKNQMSAVISGKPTQTPESVENSKSATMLQLLREAQQNPSLFHDEEWSKKFNIASAA